MRELPVIKITETVKRLCLEGSFHLPADVLKKLEEARDSEPSPVGQEVLRTIIDNAAIARNEQAPLCQDCGYVIAFLTIGQEVHFSGGSLTEAINEGVRQGYAEGYLRKSIVSDPLQRVNTGDNTPAIIHTQLVPGDEFKIDLLFKGQGSENMSRLAMLKPADGVEGVREFVLRAVDEAGPNPCPPLILGVGIGGNFEKVTEISKWATARPIGQYHPDPYYAALEKSLLDDVNKLGVGPMGLGGRTTALWLAIETFPCHIAGLPVAITTVCHSARHKSATL